MKNCLIVSIAILLLTSAPAFCSSHRSVVEISLGDYLALTAEADIHNRDSLDLIKMDRDSGSVHVLINQEGLDYLSETGTNWITVKTEADLRDDRIDSRYYNYSEVTSTLSSLESSHPSFVKRYDLATTAEGRHIWGMKISDNVSVDEDEPNILFIGLHQAREIMSTEITMDIVEYLAANYGSNPDVNNWVNTWQIWVIPMLNPDGSAYCWATDQYWIKNRTDLGGDVFGVNLAHNYPFNWGACFGSSSDPNSNYFRGSTAASEPEIQAVMTLADQFHFAAVLSYHSFNEYVLFPYGCEEDTPPEEDILRSFGSTFAASIRKEDNSYGYDLGSWWEILYQDDGNETDYFYADHGSMSYAIQVNAESYYPDYAIRDTTVQRNRTAWQIALDLFESGKVAYGHVTDACTGDPVSAQYFFSEFPLTENETAKRGDINTGRYEAIGRTGPLTLTFIADGYIEKNVPVVFGSNPIQIDVEMIPTDQPGLQIWATFIDDSTTGDGDGNLDPGEEAIFQVCLLAPGLPVTGISGIMSTSDPYVSIVDNSATWPDLPAGGAAWSEGNSFRIAAQNNTPDGHSATLTITFDADQELCTNVDQTVVTVQTYVYLCPYYEETFDSDPGWTIDSYLTNPGQPQPGPYNNWEFGIPVVGPSGAYTGSYVYGTGLDGNYDNGWTLTLTAPPIDCSDLTDTTLFFARFLQVESPYHYDYGRIRKRTTPGGNWDTIFSTGDSGWSNDSSWEYVEMDISSWADGQSSVELRFDIRADSAYNEPGFYIDDFKICGNFYGSVPPPPTPTIRPTSTPSSIPTSTPPPSFTPTPPTNTPTPTSTQTTGPGTPTNTPITPTNTPTLVPPTSTPTITLPTATPTLPGQPTNTPLPTRTPEVTFTPKPTDTPSVPTNTPVPPTETPPPELFEITLHLNDTFFEEGENFLLECEILRYGQTITVEQYIILDVYGLYFFWPSWSETLDKENHTFPGGYHETSTILEFVWPMVGGHASGIYFYAGCLYPGTEQLVGNVSFVEFGY
jgi:carboxypeptidase T